MNNPAPLQLSASSGDDPTTPISGVDEDDSAVDTDRLHPKHYTGKKLKKKQRRGKDTEESQNELSELFQEKWADDKAAREKADGQQERIAVAIESLVNHLIHNGS